MTLPLHESIQLDRHAIVNASAGTGKTYTIQNLYVRLVRERQLDPSQILVLTFTEKATAELRQKIRGELLRAQASAGASGDPRVNASLRTFDGAQIFTIHGFCQRALTQFAYENREPFRLATSDDTELYAAALRDLLRNVWPQTFGDALPGLLAYANFPDYGKWEERVIKLARQLRKRPAPADRLRPDAPTVNAVLEAQRRSKAIFARIAELSRAKLDGEPVALHQFRRLLAEDALDGRSSKGGEALLQSALRRAEQPGVDLLGAAQIFGGGDRSAENLAQTKKNVGHLLAGYRELSEIAGQLRELGRAANALKNGFTALAAWNLSDAVERFKRDEGTLSFEDMLTRLRDALDESVSPRTAPLLLQALRGRYLAAIVDEAQDTDRVQWDILQRLFAVDPRAHPQRLYAVGDPKQAIYAFRGADVQAYVRACAAMAPAAEEYTLKQNWRSSAPLIRALNRLFEADYFDADSRFRYEPVEPVPDDRRKLSVVSDPLYDGKPLVLYALNNSEFDESGPENSVPTGEIQDRVAHFVSAEIAALLEPGKMRPVLRENGKERPLEARDICVLVRSKREALPLERALTRRGIPHSYYKKEGLYESEEALELGYLFAAISRPGDNAALKRALLTSFFRLTPRELVAAGELPQEHRARVLFAAWRQKAERRQWSALFRSILDDTTVLFLDEDDDAGSAERRLMNYEHLAEELENAARRQHLDFVGMADHLHRCRFRSVTMEKDADLQRVESERSKVQLMTMHVSKGLEFPVVFLAGGLGAEPNNDLLVYHEDDALVYDIEKGKDAKAHAQAERDDEARRLYYVALTRAQVKLYVPYLRDEELTASGEVRKSRRPMVRLLGPRLKLLAEPKSPDSICVSWNRRAAAKERPVEPVPATPLALQSGTRLERVLAGSLPSDYGLRRRVHRSYSALKQDQRTFGDSRDSRASDEGETNRRQEATELPGGTEVGSLLHALLEKLDYPAVAALANAQELARNPQFLSILQKADPQGIVRDQPARVEAAAAMVWNALRTPVDPSGFALGQLTGRDRICELEFTFPLPTHRSGGAEVQGYLNGFIDLVYRRQSVGAERYYVLDWKSDTLEAYDPAAIRAHMDAMDYTLQYKVYALALSRWLEQAGLDRAAFGGIQYIFLRGVGRAPAAGVLNIDPPENLADWDAEVYARLNDRRREGGA